MAHLSSPAFFQTWVWTCSHSSLLIRAVKAEQGQNIDLMFSGVFYMQIPNSFHGLELDTVTLKEISYLQAQCQEEDADRTAFHVLCSKERRYYVGASHLRIERNRLEGGQNHLLD